MARIVPLAVAGVVLLVVFKGCGREAEFDEPGGNAVADGPRTLAPAQMGEAVLTRPEVPEAFAPAEDREVFAGLRPDDPDCARLLRLADLRDGASLQGREAHAAFYRPRPPASVAEHVFRLGPGEATRYVAKARTAARGCPEIGIPAGSREETLGRTWLRRPAGVKDAVGAIYSRDAVYSRRQGGTALSMLLVRSRNDLLVLSSAGEGLAGEPMEKLAAGAVRKLQAFQLERARQATQKTP
ncbi:hypothetical protein [Actinomadura sp. 9N407]|uniref:hypothetical protein n=1 Tax=Actinomadura sp. 9N407 TaxID=3375154 RepID=UPI00378F5685